MSQLLDIEPESTGAFCVDRYAPSFRNACKSRDLIGASGIGIAIAQWPAYCTICYRLTSNSPKRDGFGEASLRMTQFAPGRECLTCAVRSKALLCDVGEEELCAFRAMTHVLRYGPRETVFHAGHPSLGLYLLCEGKAKLTRTAVTGRRQIVELLEAGDVIETHALMERRAHESTCVTLESSRICLIEREPYQALLKRNSALTFKLIHFLGNTIARQMVRLEWLTSLDARRRLAGLLLELDGRSGAPTDGKRPVSATLTREELAEMMGVTVETVIRLLSNFRREGLVQTSGRPIRLLNAERLARIACESIVGRSKVLNRG